MDHHPVEACVGDDRGYSLCVAETHFNEAEAKLGRQWALTLSHVKAREGARAARHLRNEQAKWIKHRDSHCQALAAGSPVTQQGRNYLSCMELLTAKRTVQLKAIAQSKT